MKTLYYLLKRTNDSGKPSYHQWLRSGLIGRGRGFSETADPDFAFRTQDPIEMVVHYDYLKNVLHSPYEWEVVAYMMPTAQRSWADQRQVSQYENVLPVGEGITAWRERIGNASRQNEYHHKFQELSENYK